MSFPGGIGGVGMAAESSLKRDRAPPLSYGAVSTIGPNMAGQGRDGSRFPGTTIPFGAAAGFSGANPVGIGGVSVAGGITTTMGAPANSYAVYSIIPKPFVSEMFNANLFEKSQPFWVFRNVRSGDSGSSAGMKIGGEGRRYAGLPEYNHLDYYNVPRMHGQHPIVASLVLLNYILASSEPVATNPDDQWTARDVQDKWAFIGVARNQEGGQTYFGKVDDPGREQVINFTINGRADSVYNVFGNGITDVSPMQFIIKRVPRPTSFYLDPHSDAPLRVSGKRTLNGGSKTIDLVDNPYQIIPFQSTSLKPYPSHDDLISIDDFGEGDVGLPIQIGRNWHLPFVSNSRMKLGSANDIRAIITQPTTTVILDHRGSRLGF